MGSAVLRVSGEGNAVSGGMFSTNFLTRLFSADPDGTFARAVDLIGATGLRYPGGAMTEESFSVRDPDRAVDDLGRSLVPLDRFLDLARSIAAEVTIVIPTKNLLGTSVDILGNRFVEPDEIAAVATFARSVLQQAAEDGLVAATGLVHAFEIGNEYWGSGAMTATEYGRVVSAVAPVISAAIADILGPSALHHVGILTQMGSPWSAEFDADGLYGSLRVHDDQGLLADLGLSQANFGTDGKLTWLSKIALSNRDILDEITPEAEAALTGLVEHFYYEKRSDDLTLTSDALRYIDVDLAQWHSAGFAEKSLVITEWNVLAANDAQWGLKGAGATLFQVESMIRLGVDEAFSWPLLSSRTTDLAGNLSGAPRLSPSGALLQHMSANITGLRLLSVSGTGQELNVSAYGDDQKRVIYLCHRDAASIDLRADLTGIAGNMTLTSAQLLSVNLATSDGKHSMLDGSVVSTPWYREHDAAARIMPIDMAQSYHDGWFTAQFNSHEIAMLVFEAPSSGSSTMVKSGTDGHETLTGLDGAWTLSGGKGDDVYATDGDDLVMEHAGEGHDAIESTVSWSLGENVESLFLTGAAALSGTGNRLSNWIVGNAAANALSGGRGDDVLRGAAGNDTLTGGQGRDTMEGGTGDDTYVSSGDDILVETVNGGFDTIETSGSSKLADNIEALVLLGMGDISGTGNRLDNRISGNSGNNLLAGGRGNDTLFGQAGNDTLTGGQGRDWLNGGAGDDLYITDEKDVVTEEPGSGFDTVESAVSTTLGMHVEALVLTGSTDIEGIGNLLDNLLVGNAGANLLRGGRGDDTLLGSLGSDTLVGGNGRDTFIFNAAPIAADADWIEDFTPRIDTIVLARSGFADLPAGTLSADAFTVSDDGLATTGLHRIIYQSSSGKLFHDPDGNGSATATHFATLHGSLALWAWDFVVT